MAGEMIEIPTDMESLVCPVCTELPEAEVYQCFSGHVVCKTCFSQVTSCPQCRDELRQPVRNRFFENQLDKLQLECPFKSNGCTEELSRRDYKNHQNSCCYDFKKFGNFVNVCELLGHQNCSFLVNNGNTIEAVTHLVDHGISCSAIQDFQTVRLELTDFKNRSYGLGSCKPLILDLPSHLCYILVGAVTNHETFDLWALYLPYSNNPSLSKSPVQMDYSLFADKSSRPWKLTFSDLPVTLEDAVEITRVTSTSQLRLKKILFSSKFPENDDCLVMDLKFGPDTLSQDGTLEDQLVVCNNKVVSEMDYDLETIVEIDNEAVVSPPSSPVSLEKGSCGTNPVWHPISKNLTAWRMLKEQVNIHKTGWKEGVLDKTFCVSLPEINSKPDRDYLKYGSLFQAAKFGPVEAVNYLIKKKLNLNVMHAGSGETPLHWTMLDCNKELGLAKAKALVENGADVNALSNQNWSLLHYAAMYSDKEAVEYFVAKGVNMNGVTLKGCAPLDLAMQYRTEDDEIVQVLKNAADQMPQDVQEQDGHNESSSDCPKTPECTQRIKNSFENEKRKMSKHLQTVLFNRS